jgi:predicted small integral membrane protein
MYPTAFLLRSAKLIFVFAIGVMALLIVIGNTTDYYTNYYFVEHVMKMDTIFPDSNIHYRSINNHVLFHAAYILIIALEATMAFFCLKSAPETFHTAKNWAIAGLTIGIIIWFLGFEVIGGEWFAMWQSTTWNGLASAERVLSFLVLTLIFIQFKDETI